MLWAGGLHKQEHCSTQIAMWARQLAAPRLQGGLSSQTQYT